MFLRIWVIYKKLARSWRGAVTKQERKESFRKKETERKDQRVLKTSSVCLSRAFSAAGLPGVTGGHLCSFFHNLGMYEHLC